MLVRHLRFVLPVVSVAMLLGAAAVLAWAVLVPCQISGPGDSRVIEPLRPSQETTASAESADDSSQEAFETISRRLWQRPLFDPPPPPPPVVEKKVTPPPQVKLLATMPEAGGGRAMFSDPQGAVFTKAMGEEVAAGGSRALLTQIADDHVVLRQEDRDVTLSLRKE